MQVLHYKFFSQGESAWQILFLMLRKLFVMHLYEYDTFAVHMVVYQTQIAKQVGKVRVHPNVLDAVGLPNLLQHLS